MAINMANIYKWRKLKRDYTGEKRGKLLILGQAYGRGKNSTTLWNVRCDCGREIVLPSSSLSKNKSCGCQTKDYFHDHTGKTINGFTFLEFIGKNKYNSFIYKVKCFCNNIFEYEANDLISGKIKSCGCKLNAKSNQLYDLKTSLSKIIYRSYAHSAKKRKIIFLLTFEEFKTIIFRNCYFCNCPPSNKMRRQEGSKRTDAIFYNGIDRLDNNRGYTIENCVPACGICNQAKHRLTINRFKEMIVNIYNNLDLKNFKKEG